MSEPAPLVSFVMSMRDAAPTLGDCLRSLLSQTMTDWELVLIDDGSLDGSASIARAFADPRIHIHARKSSGGLPRRLNEAVDLARGRYIARMDADDICYPDRLQRQIERISLGDVDLVGCGAIVFRAGGEPFARFKVPCDHDGIVAKWTSGFPLPHPTWLARAEWFRRHRYDERKRKAQDQDLLLRAMPTSRFAAVPEVLLGYRQDDLSIHKSIVGRWNFTRSMFDASARRAVARSAAARTALEQAAKAFLDVIVIGAGGAVLLQRRRFAALSEEERRRWTTVWGGIAGAGHKSARGKLI